MRLHLHGILPGNQLLKYWSFLMNWPYHRSIIVDWCKLCRASESRMEAPPNQGFRIRVLRHMKVTCSAVRVSRLHTFDSQASSIQQSS